MLFLMVALASILVASIIQDVWSGKQYLQETQRIFRYNISSLAELFEDVEGSVISIDVELPDGSATGSGFVYDNMGHIVTNNHVIEGAELVDVTFIDGTTYSAKVIGTDPYADLAVLEFEDLSNFVSRHKIRPLELGNSTEVKVGDQVIAIGNPLGLSGSMSYGIVSQVGRHFPEPGAAFSIPDIIQTDADINAGNSGGPLFDFNGEVIGVNSGGLSPGEGGGSVGLNFAISSNTVKKVVPDLIHNGTFQHAWLGLYGRNVGPADQRNLDLEQAKGFILLQVFSNTPSSKAGLQSGDIIIGIDDMEIRKIEDILSYVNSKSVGDIVKLTIIRIGSNLTIPIELVERPVPEQIRVIDQPGS